MIARRGMMAGEEDVRLLMHVLAYTRGLAVVDGCLTFYSRIYRLNLYGGRPIAVEIVSDGTDTGSLSGVVFRNITFTGDKYLPAQVRGVSREFPLQNVTFDNVVFNGRQIKKADCRKYLFVNPYIENLQFK
jgi:hypothetical protein